LSSEAETTEAPADAPDERRQPLLDILTSELGDALLGSVIAKGDMWVRVDRGAWRQAIQLCKDRLEMDYFGFLSGLDWMLNPDLSGEKVWDPGAPEATPESADTGVAGGETRFQVFARLYSTTTKVGVTLKADLDDDNPTVDSIVEVYRGADWHERETWEMYGFEFTGHPGLRHLYLPGEFEGHPLRKDFPLLAREVKPWPGLVDVEALPGEPEGEGEGDGAEGAEA
jgi:NADH-quinone oxidoreductase subunit C